MLRSALDADDTLSLDNYFLDGKALADLHAGFDGGVVGTVQPRQVVAAQRRVQRPYVRGFQQREATAFGVCPRHWTWLAAVPCSRSSRARIVPVR